MKTADFARYIHMEIVGKVYIYDKSAFSQGFEIHAFGKNEKLDSYIELHGRALDASRGNRRQWSDLGRAYSFILESGWSGKVVIEISDESLAVAGEAHHKG